jgi:hypothetical protein
VGRRRLKQKGGKALFIESGSEAELSYAGQELLKQLTKTSTVLAVTNIF